MPLGLPVVLPTACAPALRRSTRFARLLKKRGLATGVGDEGGFAPSLRRIAKRSSSCSKPCRPPATTPARDLFVALDVASSEFWDDASKHYVLKKSGEGTKSSDEMIALYEDWTRQYPIVSIEDGLAEGDWPGWQRLTPPSAPAFSSSATTSS